MEENAMNKAELYMRDSVGRLVPVEMVTEIDRARDELVRELVAKATGVSKILGDFKVSAMADIGAFVDLSAEKYGAKLGGIKGNVQLSTYDGEYRIRRDMAEDLVFDERLQAAKSLIDECINEWTEGSRPEIKVLIDSAFQVDQAGKISTTRVLGLRRLAINDPKWKRAMAAISDSLQVAGTRAYLRIYRRQKNGEYKQINLDLSAL